jgi:transposase
LRHAQGAPRGILAAIRLGFSNRLEGLNSKIRLIS